MKAMMDRLRSRRLTSVFIVLSTLTLAIVVGSFAAHGVRGSEDKQVSSSDATPLKITNSTIPPNEFVRIAKAAGPAVVNINTQTLPKQSNLKRKSNPHGRITPMPQNPGDDEDDDQQGQQDGQGSMQDFFNRFFGGQAPNGIMPFGGGQMPDEGVRESLGSGFIVDPKGYIITNYHVIEKADKIYVKLSTDADNEDQGRPAVVIGTDKATDIAVIKIATTTPLPTVKIGNSDATNVGDWVEAIGSPFSLSQTVTAGIISAKNRTIEPGATGQFQHFIQTDAAINPGNSGGPLLNMNGEVIGMNTAIYTESRGYQGIGFAMPSNTIVAIYNDLISPAHKVTRGSIGIQFREGLSSAVGRVYGFKNGVIISSVTPGGPAEKAGLKEHDIIVSIDGRNIKDGDDLVNEIASRRPGSTVRIGYVREGKPEDTTVTIGDRDKIFAESDKVSDEKAPDEKAEPGEATLGIIVHDLSPSAADKIKTKGVSIQSIRSGSFADLQGLAPGLVIVRINRQPTPNKAAYDAIVSKLKSGDDVVFEIIDPRNPAGGTNYIGGTLQ
jgi:serine protease Do